MQHKVLIIGALAKMPFIGPRVTIAGGQTWAVETNGDMRGEVAVVVDGHETRLFNDPLEIKGDVAQAVIHGPVEGLKVITVKLRQVA